MEIDYIRLGDCMELMRELPDESIDMILCDLPYGTTRCRWDSVIPFEELWEQYRRIIKPRGAMALFALVPFAAELIHSNLKDFRYEWVWEKPAAVGFLNAGRAPMRAHENILIFSKKPTIYNPQKIGGGTPYHKKRNGVSENVYGYRRQSSTTSNGERFPRDVVKFKRDRVTKHPTEKPVPLLEYMLRTYTNEGDIVLDNCMGSGSTCVACVNTGRHYIGFEKEAKYFEVARERIEQAKLDKTPTLIDMMEERI